MVPSSTLQPVFAALMIALAGIGSPAKASDTLDYSLDVISPSVGRLSALHVCVALTANATGTTEIALPNAWGRGNGFYKRLDKIAVTGAKLVKGEEPDQLTLTSKPGARVRLCYDVKPNLADQQESTVATDFSQPLVGPRFFHAFGPQIFPWVDGQNAASVRFVSHVPKGWRLVSDLEHLPDTATISDIFNSVVLAGYDLDVSETKAGDTTVRVAMRGQFGFDRHAFEGQLANIIAQENEFWHGGPANFLVTVIPMNAANGQEGIQGSARRDAFALIASPRVPTTAIGFTFAHEYFHNWNSKQIGGYREGAGEIEDRWLSEGFTDYFGRKVAKNAGVYDDSTLRHAWDEVYERQARSPAANLPNSQIPTRIGEEDVQQLPYDRGALFACYLESRLETKGKNLQAYMLAMRAKAQSDPSFAGRSAVDRLTLVMEGELPDIRDMITRYIELGDTLPAYSCY